MLKSKGRKDSGIDPNYFGSLGIKERLVEVGLVLGSMLRDGLSLGQWGLVLRANGPWSFPHVLGYGPKAWVQGSGKRKDFSAGQLDGLRQPPQPPQLSVSSRTTERGSMVLSGAEGLAPLQPV